MNTETLYSPRFGCIMSDTKLISFTTLLYEEENQMKKLLALLLALAMVFSMAACSGGSNEPAPAEPSGEGEGSEETAA